MASAPDISGKKIHFSANVDAPYGINVETKDDDISVTEVSIGFLKTGHRYGCKFHTPNPFGPDDPLDWKDVSQGLKIVNCHTKDDSVSVSLEIDCRYKDGSVTESFVLTSSKSSLIQTVHVHMLVLKKDQGTPALKKGVRQLES